jgi:hypothetical protein
VALSQLKELGEQAVAAVAASLVDGGAVLKAQLIASRFYEAVRYELEESPMDNAKRAALIAASDRCERIAAANINPNALLDELRKAIAVLQADTDTSAPTNGGGLSYCHPELRGSPLLDQCQVFWAAITQGPNQDVGETRPPEA